MSRAASTTGAAATGAAATGAAATGARPAGTGPAGTSPAGSRLPGWARGRSGVMAATALGCAVEMVPGLPGLPLTLAGLWLLLLAPTLVWRGTAARAVSTRDGSLLLAVGLTLITDMVVALGVNTLLPLVGDARPLTRTVLAAAAALTVIVLGMFLPEEARAARAARTTGARPGLPRGALPVGALGAVALLLSVAGPIRLNNGLGGGVSTVALVAVAALLLLVLVRRGRYPAAVLGCGLYAASLSLLLLVSLRGWYITGHDIQREYEYFQLTLGGSRWNVAAYPNPYNACLSITLLPVSLVRLTAIPGVYVFKIVLPLLFALTPLLVHRTVRNVAPQLVSLLSAVFFLVFPTFYTDMTYLGRQEIAFVLLGCAMVVVTDTGRPLRARRTAFTVLLAGIVLSHYSTTYVVVGVLGIGFATDLLWRLVTRGKRRRLRRRDPLTSSHAFVSWWMVLVPAVLAVVWAAPITHTSGQLQTTLGNVYQGIAHLGHGQATGTPQQQLADYRAQTLIQTAGKRAGGSYLPLSTVNAYPVTAVPTPNLPLTAAGRALQATGVSTVTVNGLLREAAALGFEALLLLGLVVTLRGRRKCFRPARDQVTLTVGSVGMVALLTVLPQLAVDYSVQRAFQQGLFCFAPFIAAGALRLARWFGRRSVPVVCVLVIGLFLDLTGVVPKVLGGYPAQLQLSNSGQYYDVYYPTTQERMASYWLSRQIDATPQGRPEPVVQTDSFTFSREQTLFTGPVMGDIFPTVLDRNAYVLLGTTTVVQDTVTIYYQGDLVTYRYPMGLLQSTKDEIYSNEGAEIYR